MSRARAASDLIIAPIREEDLPAVLAIEAATFSAPWTEEMFRWELEQAGTGLAWVARRGERVVGYLFTWVVAGEFHINNIAVAPAYRGQGIADALLKTGLGEAVGRGARVALLEVRESNAPARALYARWRFAVAGRRKRYYSHPTEDALLMRCEDLPGALARHRRRGDP
ncbi:MAG: ribosomal protein S18-alanine N-acetyltransferase [candidate division NC10 bacterium]|nr:ribosomal protein S18-alanine N-acetyltransferase [candidate division NC10 bacterium]